MSTPDERRRMARAIVDFEARRDRKGRLAVYRLPTGDGGGAYEVAGINQKYNRATCDRLVSLLKAGRYEEAEALATDFIARNTDAVAGWSRIPAIEFYLRDSKFNRGLGGAGRIVQRALGVEIDGRVNKDTRTALAAAERDASRLLQRLRKAREDYERYEIGIRAKFWRGLVNRWDKALVTARSFSLTAEGDTTPKPKPKRKTKPKRKPKPKHAPAPSPLPDVPEGWRLLRLRRRGDDVAAWQAFLRKQRIDPGPVDGIFGPLTHDGTVRFQRRHRLKVDGIVGPETFGKAISLGYRFEAPDTPRVPDLPAPRRAPERTPDKLAYPARPHFKPRVTTRERQRIFGTFRFVPAPTGRDPRTIRILGSWQTDNIVSVPIPQLRKALGPRAPRTIAFHRLAAAQLQGLWQDWEAAGLLDRVLSYAGAFNPRFIGGTRSLSNHAFGTAFDINAEFNPWKRTPARPGQRGCVYELVPFAIRRGFYWGGHFSKRSLDGMHFDVAVILS